MWDTIPKTPAADLAGIPEPCRSQCRHDRWTFVAQRVLLVRIHHDVTRADFMCGPQATPASHT